MNKSSQHMLKIPIIAHMVNLINALLLITLIITILQKI